MVSVYPSPPAPDFYLVDPMKMGLPGLNSLQALISSTDGGGIGNAGAAAGKVNPGSAFLSEDHNKKVRKPYTITKSRESWTEQEHDKFLEALQLFDRDWKKIEAFVGSKTVIQIRSHAQKYFLKVQKNGTSEHVPPPRPKRKATHPYPQKAPKNAVHQTTGPFQASASLLEPGYPVRPDSLSVPRNPLRNEAFSSGTFDNNVPPVRVSHITKDDVGSTARPAITYNCCSSSNESTPKVWSTGESNDQAKGTESKQARVMPDFAQVYSFIGSIFDPNASDHLQKLKKMDPINVETVLLLMKNLSFNLTSPEFENHKRFLLSCDSDFEKVKSGSAFNDLCTDKPGKAIQSA